MNIVADLNVDEDQHYLFLVWIGSDTFIGDFAPDMESKVEASADKLENVQLRLEKVEGQVKEGNKRVQGVMYGKKWQREKEESPT